MAEQAHELELIDGDTGRVYVFHLSTTNFMRATSDIHYCTQLLANAKKIYGIENAASEKNEPAKVNEATEENKTAEAIKATDDEITDENEATEKKEAGDKFSGDAHNDGFRWVDSAVQLLLTEFKQREDLLHSGKMSVQKFWDLISIEMAKKGYQITGPQCKSKLNGLKKTYKNVKDHNGKSGNNRRLWPYLEVMDTMFGHKPWVRSSNTLDSATISPSSPACSSDGTSPSPPPGQGPSKQSPFSIACSNKTSPSSPTGEGPHKRRKVSSESSLEKLLSNIQQKREDRKKMHEDAMSRQDRLLALLERIAEK